MRFNFNKWYVLLNGAVFIKWLQHLEIDEKIKTSLFVKFKNDYVNEKHNRKHVWSCSSVEQWAVSH